MQIYRFCARWGIPLAMAFVVLATSAGCYQKAKKRDLAPPEVHVAEAKKQEIRQYKDYTGKTKACESVSIPARVQGFLEKMTFTPGQFVKKDDPLFIIEQTQYRANVERAKADLTTARADCEYAKSDYERTVELYNSNKSMTLDDVQNRARNYEQAQAAVESAAAALVEAELQFSYTEVNAPINGKISRNLVDVGNLVGEISTAFTPLATINNMDPMYVYFDISDGDFYQFVELYGHPTIKARRNNGGNANGQTPESKDDSKPEEKSEAGKDGKTNKNDDDVAWPFVFQLVRQDNDEGVAKVDEQYPYKGVINYIDNTINPNMGSIVVRGEIENSDYAIYPGAVCHIKVPSTVLPDATVVYDKAVAKDLSNYYMFVINKEKKVERRIVEKGPAVDREFCVILSGIKPGETYIVEGLQKVRVDQEVAAKPYDPKKNKPADKNADKSDGEPDKKPDEDKKHDTAPE